MVEQSTDTKQRGIGEIGRARSSVAAIETLADIRRRARTVATDAERVSLSGWSGWGPLTKLFTADETWVPMAERVREALPEPDVNMGMRGTYMAFYTPRELAAGIWKMLELFGFDGGPVAELGCGGGVFFDTAPEGVQLVGVERDPTAAGICQLMHPSVRVINEPLEKVHLPSRFSAVVGNVPFGDVNVHDPHAPASVKDSLHNYFIWRAVRALAPGGYAALITSRFTMDGWRFDARSQISEDADFVGAIRLPNGALGGGTDTVADIVILRRKGGTEGETYGQAWQDTTTAPWSHSEPLNQWWLDEPHTVLGEMGKGATTQYGLGLSVKPREGRGSNLVQQLLSVARHLVNDAKQRNLMWTPPARPEEFDARAAGVVDDDGWHEGSMRLDGSGGVLVVVDGKPQPLPKPKAELLRLLRMRDLAVKLAELEANYSLPDSAIEPTRADLRAEYEAYVKLHGPLNRFTQRPDGFDDVTGDPQWKRIYPRWDGFRHDPDSFLVLAMEVFNEPDDGDFDEQDATAYASPAPILTSRQNRPPKRPTRTDNPEQALAWSLDRFAGQVRIDYIAALLGRPLPDEPAIARAIARDEVAALLGDKVYRDPETLQHLTAEEYLSGPVRDKHATAVQAASVDSDFTRNVQALEAALPKWLEPEDITAQLGTPWIGAADLQQFIVEVLDEVATVRRANGQWEVDKSGLGSRVTASAVWGTEDVDAFTLLQLALNGKTPTVYRTVYDAEGNEKKVKDFDKSMLATGKQEELKQRFAEWVWEDHERTDRLVAFYNNTYNNLRPRQYDGSRITVDGMADWFKPYPHQLEFVARAMATPAALCGHPVGAGKTFTMAMTAIKLKQAGLIRKPMLVVPNHLIEQQAREIMQLFPAARVLVGSSKTIAAKRLAFTARCATQDWDLVLVTHSAFNAMDVDPDTQAAYYDQLEEEMRNGVIEGAPGKELKGRMVKNLAKMLDRMRTKIQDLREKSHARDKGVRFEQLGVDYLLIDEFHYYKNLAMPCNTEGFSIKPSKRATDLDMKIQYLRARNEDGPHAALFSGTPVSNTMLELYVCLHYTMRPYMKKIGLGSADSWAAAFVQFVTSVEVTVDGGQFQMRTRPSLFVNAPELRVLLSQSADIRTAEQLGLKRPASELHIESIEPTDTQAWYSTELVERADDVRNRIVKPEIDNMLKICTDGRRMATDPHLVGLADDGEYKLHVVADNVTTMWRENPGKLQVVFLDLGTPKQRKGGPDGSTWMDYQSYGRLRRMLTDRGIDIGRIRFIHDAKSDADKARLFRDCRNGKVDVIVGSTDKLGVGTNIQNLIVAMHHVDAPFRPADVEQRDGRGLRPGNLNKLVHIFRYVTKRTFDAYMWQMLTRKLTFIGQMLSGVLDRTIEDVTGDDVLSFAAIKAAATDQPLLREKAECESLVKKLKLKLQGHRRTVQRMREGAPAMRRDAQQRAADAKAWQAIAAATTDIDLDDDEVIGQIMEEMPQFAYYRKPLQYGRLTISWRRWSTGGIKPEAQPMLQVDGGEGYVTEKAYRFWKSRKVRDTLREVLERADGQVRHHLTEQHRLLADADKADAVVARPFEQMEELTDALARLARVERDLQDAASTRAEPSEAAGDIVLEAEEMTPDELARVEALASSVLAGLAVSPAVVAEVAEPEQDLAEQVGSQLAALLGL